MNSPVYIIAEAGSNWRMGSYERDIEMAKRLIDIAVEAKADAVKFQTFRPESVYVENAGISDYLSEAGIRQDIREIFTDLAMPYEMISLLSEYCQRCSIDFLSSSFSPEDFHAVDPHVSIHKIASYEITHLRLLELAGRSGKPLILSTGGATEEDISWALEIFRKNGGQQVSLLQCTLDYPAQPKSVNLRVILWLKARFAVPVGLSDHTRDPLYAPIAAVALGSTIIEKHFTLDNRLPGPDHSFAITPQELKEMVKAIRTTEQMLGSGVKQLAPEEQELHAFAQRGVQALRTIHRGERLQEGDTIAILRPGKQSKGIHPRFLPEIEGTVATRLIPVGAGIQRGDWSP